MNDNKSAYNSDIYDGHIIHVLPYYREYHKQIIDLVKTLQLDAPKWLDTGCGTGTLALKALEAIPDAQFTLVDPSPNMLDEVQKKLKGREISLLRCPSHLLPFEDQFDVITAVLCHHYYNSKERKEAVKRCYQALKKNGILIVFENIRMSTELSDEIALQRWLHFLEREGNPPRDVQIHANRRGCRNIPNHD